MAFRGNYLEVTGRGKKHVRGRAEEPKRQKWPEQGEASSRVSSYHSKKVQKHLK